MTCIHQCPELCHLPSLFLTQFLAYLLGVSSPEISLNLSMVQAPGLWSIMVEVMDAFAYKWVEIQGIHFPMYNLNRALRMWPVCEIAVCGCWLPLFYGLQREKYTPPLLHLSLALSYADSSRARGLWIDRSALIALELRILLVVLEPPSAICSSQEFLFSSSILSMQSNCLLPFFVFQNSLSWRNEEML